MPSSRIFRARPVRRTKGTKTSFDRKYEKVHDLLATDHELMGKIKKVSAAYGIDPIHVDRRDRRRAYL